MQFKIPKNTEKYYWTKHSLGKMRQYNLSAQRVLRVIRSPQRTEKGIVKNTIAVMQPASTRIKDGKRIWSREIWAMYQIRSKQQEASVKIPLSPSQSFDGTGSLEKGEKKQANELIKFTPWPEGFTGLIPKKLKIISAWIYPGISPKNNPIPEDILREIEEI